MYKSLFAKLLTVIHVSLCLICPGCFAVPEGGKTLSSVEDRSMAGAEGKNKIDARSGYEINDGPKEGTEDFPEWVRKMIEKEKAGRVANPPASISRCVYGSRVVYYRPPRCCEIPGILWDENGKFVCSPDGGLTGRGDGKCPHFHAVKKNCAIIWRDSRSLR